MSPLCPSPHWKVLERLGRGSVFEVERVAAPGGAEAILKRPVPYASERAHRALEREERVLMGAAAARAAESAPVLPLSLGAGVDARGSFLVETRAPGHPVRTFLEPGLRLNRDTWIFVTRALTRALAYLHELRDEEGPLHLVHGDISPDNIFFAPPSEHQPATRTPTLVPSALQREPTVTFIDLSTASWRHDPDPVWPGARGTLPYAAPEIARGEAVADQSTDVYALAAIALRLAVGPVIASTSEASLLFEVGSRGLRLESLGARLDLPPRCRDALVDALRFDRTSRSVCTARELLIRLDDIASV